jgi:transcriptional regulator with XRE-family HTH domain
MESTNNILERRGKIILFPLQTIALGKRIEIVRELKGLSQKELACAAHIHYSNLSLLEHGKCNPCWDTLMILNKALQTSPCALIDCDELWRIVE